MWKYDHVIGTRLLDSRLPVVGHIDDVDQNVDNQREVDGPRSTQWPLS